MGKQKLKKFIFFLSIFTFFTFVCLFIAIKIDDSKFLSDNTKYDSKYLFKVTYLIVDKDKTTKNVKIKELNYDNSNKLNFLNEVIPLEKNGDYLYGDLKKFTNSLSLNGISDYVFTMNNLNGEVIEDCIFNKKEKTIKIPYSYYKNKTQKVPVQMEIVSRVSKKEIQNVKFNVFIKNIFTNKIEVTQLGYDTMTSFTISNSKPVKLKKENLEIYLNNTKVKLKSTDYDFNAKTGMISINSSVMIVNNVDIKINTSFFNKLALTKVHATESTKTWEEIAKSMKAIELEEAPIGLKKGTSYTVNISSMSYGGSDEYDSASAKYSYYYNVNDCGEGCVNGDKMGSGYSAYGIIDMSKLNIDTIKIVNNVTTGIKITFPEIDILAMCSDHSTSNNGTNENVNVTLTALTDIITDSTKKEKYIVMGLATEPVFTQNMQVAFKLSWEEDSKCNLQITKNFKGGTTNYVSTVDVQIYGEDDNTCSGDPIRKVSIAVGKGKSSVKKTVKNLDKGTYYIKETAYTRDHNDADLLEHGWDYTTGCKKVVLDDSDETTSGNCLQTEELDNVKQKYCFKVKKVDADSSSTTINNISFTANGETKTTSNGGIVTFSELPYKNYTVKESSNDGDSGYWNYGYWNDDTTNISNSYTVQSSGLTKMTYSNGSYSCPSNANTYTKADYKLYYCLKVKKVDAITGEIPKDAEGNILEAKFKINNGSVEYEKMTTNGVATFMLGTTGGQYTVTEEEAPAGYAKSSASLPINATLMPKGTTSTDSLDVSKCNASDDSFTYPDGKLVLNWYKTTEDKNTGENGAKFKVKTSNNNYVTVDAAKVSQIDSVGVTKTCYAYSGEDSTGSELESYNAGAMNGEVCIIGIPEGTYTIEETKPGKYHTFGSVASISLTTSTTYQAITDTDKFVNYPTSFEFTKNVSNNVDGGDGDEIIVINGVQKTLSQLTTEELKKIDFQIFKTDSSGNPTGNPLSFVLLDGEYKYLEADDVTGSAVTNLNLNDNRKIIVSHLDWDTTYSIREVQSIVCGGSETDCIGYYYPNYNEQSSNFTITTCSNPNANTTLCPSGTNKTVLQSLINTPTELKFTKKDFYSYNDAKDIIDSDRPSDVVDNTVEFENDKERSDFDRITFKLKNDSNQYLTLKFIRNVGKCDSDSSYALYKYVSSDQSDTSGTELHTCGGHIKITNLCRGNTYTVEEVAVPNDSVYVKEVDNNGQNPSVSYAIPCTDGTITPESETVKINDKGTRVRFEKRDSKYNYLIPDETTTFEVYRCAQGVECHPTDNKDENGNILESDDYKLVKFDQRAIMTKDEEDSVDAEGLAGVEVYRAMSDSDVASGKKYVTELHPYKGILVLRYLQSGYDYVLVETVAPKNYTLPLGRNAETKFTVTNETVSVDEVDVPNKPTSILIKKYSSDGNLLTGAQFKVYEGTTCDVNLSAMNQPKVELKLKTIRDGVYENRPNQDTSVITTCTDKEDSKCSDIPVNEITKLTYTDYLGSWTNFKNTTTEDGTSIELQEGEALIQYLEYGHCYIIEEIKAPEGYSLPKNEEDRFTMVTIEENDSYAHDTGKTLVNTPTPFTFYKLDEFNKPLDGAEFKLQKLDDNKKYHDVTVSKDETKQGNYYKADSTTNNVTITTIGGSATVYYLSAGQYRIVETKAAPGKELTKNPNVATFFVDESGNVFGSSIIVNKAKTEKIKVVSSAKSELVVNIQTGQTVIKYGLIIAILLAAITGLIILKKKTK